MKKTVIVDACRTPIGNFAGSLASESAVGLGENCLQKLLKRVEKKIPTKMACKGEESLLQKKPYFKDSYYLSKSSRNSNPLNSLWSAILVEEAIIGNVLSAGLGQNPARQIILNAGLPRRVPAFTLNQVCASGMKAVVMADHMISTGINTVMIAGGCESMSNTPYLLKNRNKKPRLGSLFLEDSIMCDGLSDAFHDYPMGVTAENLAQRWKISREEQDEFAYYSQLKASKAEKSGRFKDERMEYKKQCIDSKSSESKVLLNNDEYIRHDVNLEKLASLKPVFVKGGEGTVTAGNSSGVNDGAAMLYLMEASQAQSWGIKPLATIVASVTVAIDETIMGYTPWVVIQELLRRTGLSLKEIFSLEINEAFASQILSVLKDLVISEKEYNRVDNGLPTKVNPWGGAIALGHPIGCSGARIITTLAHTLQLYRLDFSHPLYGIATLCVGGGQGCGVLLKV